MAIYIDNTFRAHGKLLLTAEYFVLDGALALALPTQVGQTLRVQSNPHTDGLLHWESWTVRGKRWFSGQFALHNFACVQSTDEQTAQRLTEILNAIRQLQPGFLSRSQSLKATTHLEFPRLWGLGTSSTLIATLAQWAGVDPHQLLEKTFGGSGYDLACANAGGPIFYHREAGKPVVQAIDFSPAFSDQLYFVFLEQKQNSREGIARYRQQQNPAPLEAISRLSKAIAKSETLSEFSKLLEKHENLVGDFIRIAPVKKRLFSDFWGSVKSLGAWGGDFVLVTSEYSEEETRNYYNEKGYPVFLKYTDLILKSN